MPDLKHDDITLHYEVDGNGPPLLLLAGMLSDSASWAALAPLLTDRYTVIRPDNRTTGRTTPWDAEVTVQHMAADAQALMRELGHDRYHLAGHSMGGLMAMELAGLEGEAIASLSILASGPVRIPRTTHVFDTMLAVRRTSDDDGTWLRTLYPWIFRPAFFADPGAVDTALQAALAYPYGQNMDAMAHQIEALRSFRPRTRPADLTCPVQVIYAAEDLLIPERRVRAVFAAIPGVEQHTIPDAGHSIHWDAPGAVAERLTAFMTKHPTQEAS